MGFFKEIEKVDLGHVPVENIFINDFMPTANGTFVKVYLLGFKFANDSMDVSNKTIAKHLNIPLQDVIDAWNFWEEKNVIKIHPKEKGEDSSDFDIEFVSLRQLFISHNFSENKTQSKPKDKYIRNVDVLTEMQKNEDIRKMFYELQDIFRRELQPPEKLKVLNWIERYNLDLKVVIQAFKFSVEKKKKKNLNYIGAILRNWHDEGIITFKDLEDHFNKNTELYRFYKRVYKTLGYSNSLISAGDKEIMNKWVKQYKLDQDLIIETLIEASKKTSNINMNYMDVFITKIYEENLDDPKAINKQSKSKKKNTSSNKFHNFDAGESDYTDEELDKVFGTNPWNKE